MNKREEWFTRDHPFEDHYRWLATGIDVQGHHESISERHLLLSALRLHTGETFRAGFVAAGIALQTKAFETATTAADRAATE